MAVPGPVATPGAEEGRSGVMDTVWPKAPDTVSTRTTPRHLNAEKTDIIICKTILPDRRRPSHERTLSFY
jgi:hypothetical protein